MPRLYLHEYHQALQGQHVCISCREGILRDNFNHIVADLKFLHRQGIRTTLYHNMANRFANQKHFRLLADRLPDTTIIRLSPEVDFYSTVLDRVQSAFKIIFLERKYLYDRKGRRLNTLTTRDTMDNMSDLVANVNLVGVLGKICQRINEQRYNRVHILPAGKNSIKYELFTVEGTGTLIADNFQEKLLPVISEGEVQMLAGILGQYMKKGFLKPRSKKYLSEHRQRFYLTMIDGIAVGCVELIEIDANTVELGALAISTRFRNQRVGVFTVNAFIDEAKRLSYNRIISLTNNPRLHILYEQLGFEPVDLPDYALRQTQSPDVQMFFKALDAVS